MLATTSCFSVLYFIFSARISSDKKLCEVGCLLMKFQNAQPEGDLHQTYFNFNSEHLHNFFSKYYTHLGRSCPFYEGVGNASLQLKILTFETLKSIPASCFAEHPSLFPTPTLLASPCSSVVLLSQNHRAQGTFRFSEETSAKPKAAITAERQR